ncbi:putative membrane protein [Asticcacaulis biprosthecium C19]|uniref:Putative membrane protein n=1 Tax=Asticcacaulis biprosthecium C19 TaxID=715226 RepID=F4QNS3_9CAUL|nr:hypothetical protein [Asticcacaulis biprosthecium]EGF90981.1 putative membrane protein [Asticcacaulis biprosthecium C19]
MSLAPMPPADAAMNAIALAGLAFALVAVPRGPRAGPLDRRLGGLYTGLLVFLALRQIFWAMGQAWIVPLIMAAAAWLPLLILLLAEEVLRRHAARTVKWFVLAGGVASTLAALTLGANWPPLALRGFAAFQVLTLALVIGFILKNRRYELSPAETRMADSVALALVVCLPLTLSEFRGLFPGLPVTLAALGVLLFAVMSSALAAGVGSPARFGLDLSALAATAAVVTTAMAWLVPALGTGDLVRLGVAIASVNAAALIIARLNQARRLGHRRSSIAATLAALPDPATPDMMIGAHPTTAAGRIIAGDGLALYGADIVTAIGGHRVLNRATTTEPEIADAIRNLLDEHGATHLLRLSPQPLRLLAIASGSLGGSDAIETDLALLSRLVEGQAAC